MSFYNPLYEYEKQDYITAHGRVLSCFDKVDDFVKLYTSRNGEINVENLAEFIFSDEACKSMQVDIIQRLVLAFRALLEIKKISPHLNDNDCLKRFQKIQAGFFRIKLSGANGIPYLTDDVIHLVSIVCFQGAMLDMCEPEYWPEDLINEFADEAVFKSIRNYSFHENRYNYLHAVKFYRYIAKWYWGWKWFLPGSHRITENNGLIWLEKAVKKGNIKAIKLLARHYENKWIRDDNHKKEAALYLQAAIRGDTESERIISDYCYEGYGVEKNNDESIKWLRKAVEKGDGKAMRMLGHHLLIGDAIEKNYTEAVELLKAASHKKDVPASRLLAYCYGNGLGVDKNLEKAAELYEHAAERYDEYARWNISMFYFDGKGVEKNPTKAYAWMLKIGNAASEFGLEERKQFYEYKKELEETLSDSEKEEAKKLKL